MGLAEQLAQMQQFRETGSLGEEAPDGEQPTAGDRPTGGESPSDGESRKAEETPKKEPTTPEDGGQDGGEANQEVETPPEGVASEGDGDDPLENLKQENAYLRQKMDELLRSAQSPEGTQSSDASNDPLAELSTFDPIGTQDVDAIIANPDTFKEWANSAFGELREKLAAVMKNALPAMARQYAGETVSNYEKAREFYETNDDLKPYKSVVGTKLKELTQKHNDKSLDDLLNMVAAEVRKELKLKAPEEKAKETSRKQAKSSLPSKGAKSSTRSRATEEPVDDVARQIDDMLAVIDQ